MATHNDLDLIDGSTAAEIIGIATSQVSRYLAKYVAPIVDIPHHRLWRRQDVERYAADHARLAAESEAHLRRWHRDLNARRKGA